MSTILTIINAVVDSSAHVAQGTVEAVGQITNDTGTTLLGKIRAFVMPFIAIAIAAISVTFLVRRQMSQFLQFIGISILVVALMYAPEIITKTGEFVSNMF